MANSHIKLTGGIGNGIVVQNTISATSHGFSAGMAVRYDVATSGYTAAIADSALNSEVIGVVSEIVGVDKFVYTT